MRGAAAPSRADGGDGHGRPVSSSSYIPSALLDYQRGNYLVQFETGTRLGSRVAFLQLANWAVRTDPELGLRGDPVSERRESRSLRVGEAHDVATLGGEALPRGERETRVVTGEYPGAGVGELAGDQLRFQQYAAREVHGIEVRVMARRCLHVREQARQRRLFTESLHRLPVRAAESRDDGKHRLGGQACLQLRFPGGRRSLQFPDVQLPAPL